MTEFGRKLLVIDDDTIVRQSIAAYLEDSGFNVHQESDGRSAMAWFKLHQPDVVLTDLRMPEVDGLTILEAVRQSNPETAVIVISGMGVVGDVVKALRLGAADYLLKPIVDMEVLVHSVNRSLERRDLLNENRRYREELERANRELREYVRVLERDQQAGRKVQSNLLPPTPVNYGHFHVCHKVIPSLYLSGDFIDYGLVAGRYLAFYLTDVSGHGASSAFVTVWLKQLVRRMFRERRIFQNASSLDTDPALMLKTINNEIFRSQFGCHLTCFVGVIDTHTHEMSYVLGGHLPLPVLIGASSAEFLYGKGKPLGIFEDAEWQVNKVKLPPKFSLVVFSDGVLEVLPPQDLIAKEAYLLDLLSNSDGNLESIYSQLKLNEGEAAPDDIAILTISTEAAVA
jgi:sigma-B regulation protein RsbU (phosphoserine phosphatase)